MASTYDVTIPHNSGYSPVTYTEEIVVTNNRIYEFAFIDHGQNVDSYNNLKQYIMSSLKTKGQEYG